jgi:prepilin-type N-terminal cleavage/methylation domain-containing protein
MVCISFLRKKRGFTLLETMVALSIFTVGIMSIGSMLIYSTKARVFNRQLNFAIAQTNGRLEELRKIGSTEVDVRYNSVMNFGYILSRDPNYGSVDGFLLPGLLSGAGGYTAGVTDIMTHAGLTTAEKTKRVDDLIVLFDDGDLAGNGDVAAADGIWSSLEFVNMDTGEAKVPSAFGAMSAPEKRKWHWILKRTTVVEPIRINRVVFEETPRMIIHVNAGADISDTTWADVIRIRVESKWVDMARIERAVTFSTIVARGSQ